MDLKKHLCECNNMATWVYMSSSSSDASPFHCDDCVPRGCTCHNKSEPPPKDSTNWKWIQHNVIWAKIDSQGREFPCCEFEYDEEGFDVDDDTN